MVREDIESVGVVEEDVVNRGVWRKKTRCWRPRIGKAERKRKKESTTNR